MKNRRTPRLLALTALIAVAGCEPVDNDAATRAKGWDGELTNNVLDGDRQVFVTIDESEDAQVATGCDKTALDAVAALQKNCASCHTGTGALGTPMFDFVMDLPKLRTATWPRQGQPALRFLTPGDAENSLIFTRPAMARDMPPLYNDLARPDPPRITFSEASVLREWIEVCDAQDPPEVTTAAPGAGN